MKKDLTGKRFGKLRVISPNSLMEDRYRTWNCQCDCGGEIIVNTKRLTRGTVTDCGCIGKNPNRRGTIPMDLTGEYFGRLTVIKRAENIGSYTAWLCRCSCGNEKIVKTHELRSGGTKSCGCIMKDKDVFKGKDIEGEVFGRLTAMEPTKQRDEKGSAYWKCRCECGNEVIVSEDDLKSGNTKSCGCLAQEIRKDIWKQLTLVDGTCVEWLEKRKHRSDNTSGFRGVYAKGNRYKVYIGLQGKKYYIGTYETFEEAVESRLYIENALHNGFVETWRKYTKNGTDPSAVASFFYNVTKTGDTFLIESPCGIKIVNTHS